MEMNFENTNILIIGVNSSLGRVLANILSKQKANIIGTYNKHKLNSNYDIFKCDITNEDEVKNIIKQEKPDVIIHCAAMTNVDLCEDKVQQAYDINGNATGYLAKAADVSSYVLKHGFVTFVLSAL